MTLNDLLKENENLVAHIVSINGVLHYQLLLQVNKIKSKYCGTDHALMEGKADDPIDTAVYRQQLLNFERQLSNEKQITKANIYRKALGL